MLDIPSLAAPRARVVNRVRQQLQAKLAISALDVKVGNDNNNDDGDDGPKIENVDPGWMQLFSYFAPGLKAGGHTIEVKQRILAPHGSFLPPPPADPTKPATGPPPKIPDPARYLELTSHQEFSVFGPRFSLPEGIVHQTYPPQGQTDHNHVLPHIVFNDPHLPWEQIGSPSEEVLGARAPGGAAGSTTTTPNRPRGSTPWLALLVFTETELQLSKTDILFPADPTRIPKQSKTTLGVDMTLADILNLNSSTKIVTPVRDDPSDPIDQSEQTQMIFVPQDLFTSLVCSYNDRGERIMPVKRVPDLSRYKFMAHVRNINTRDMAASSGVEDQGLFSIVISHRTGPAQGLKRVVKTPNLKTEPSQLTTEDVHLPKAVIVHLVSLEGVEKHITLPLQYEKVGLVSLYSWTYSCLPPDSINFVETMRNIGHQLGTQDVHLGPPDSILTRILSTPDPTTSKLRDRLHAGYSLVRWLPRNGDQSVALTRGPLVPRNRPGPMPSFWPLQVNFSSGLQILDPDLYMMDISYSTAWELGRTMAIADRTFAAAMVRLRREVDVYATIETKKDPATPGVFRSKMQVIGSLPQAVELMAEIPKGLEDGNVVIDPAKRWKSLVDQSQGDASGGEVVAGLMRAHALTAMEVLASTPPSTTQFAASSTDPEDVAPPLLPYNEINIPNSNDWALILKWIIDKLYLYQIPAHYLITDPSHLPPESIRFFYIDDNWFDMLIDGALSIGNNLSRHDDTARQAMKLQLNRYFTTPIEQDHHTYPPQIPKFGFLLRSAVVKAFPNLEVHAPWPNQNDPRLQVLRMELIEEDVMLCLFDRVPGSPEFSTLVISQPPHQQRFAMGTGFLQKNGVNTLNFEFLKMFTDHTSPDAGKPVGRRSYSEGSTTEFIFDWDNNTIVLPKFAEVCNQVLHSELVETINSELVHRFTDTEPSSAVVGLQLNDGISKITIQIPPAPADRVAEFSRVREIAMPPLPPTVQALKSQFSTAAVLAPEQPDPEHIHRFLSPAMLAGPRAAALPTATATATAPPHRPAAVAVTAPPMPPGGQHASQFQITTFVIGQHKKPLLLPLYPSTSSAPPNLPLDLIFSFLPSFNQIPGLQIFRINLFIPLGPKPTDLVAVYKGPGARMLSNQRFNVDVRTENGSVNVTLLPRSTTLLVPLEVNPDVSFVLNQVSLNGVEGDVRVEVREVYKAKRPDGKFVSSEGVGQIVVRKRWWGKG